MSDNTRISWTDDTDNAQAGCVKASTECTHCYAEGMSWRLANMGHELYQGVTDPATRRWTGRVNYDPVKMRAAFEKHACRRRARRAWLGSMTDLFLPSANNELLCDLADLIREYHPRMVNTGHRRLLLTKHPAELLRWQREEFPEGLPSWVWVGVTAGHQRTADERVPLLQQVVTDGVRFLSCEPLLSEVRVDLGGIHWAISGDESGRKKRPTDPNWHRFLRNQCVATGVSFFLKQMIVDGKKVERPFLDGQQWQQVPA